MFNYFAGQTARPRFSAGGLLIPDNVLLGLKVRSHSGDNGDEDPPVPIPNTEVKLVYAESTWHRAPGRIGSCRISFKNARFQSKTGVFLMILTVFVDRSLLNW